MQALRQQLDKVAGLGGIERLPEFCVAGIGLAKAQVAGDAATVESITRPGAEIHEYQPTPGDLVRAQGADLILWNGMNLERGLERFFENIKYVPSVIVTDGITPLPIREGPYKGIPNPHAWMSPSNALIYIENISKALVEHDPAHADKSATKDKLRLSNNCSPSPWPSSQTHLHIVG